MSNENQDSDQITKGASDPKGPKTQANKEKDPKKVAAGRKLAEYNRKAKEALKREMDREAENDLPDEGSGSGSGSWLPELSFTAVLSIAGIGLTAVDLFSRFRDSRQKVDPGAPPPPPPNTPTDAPTSAPLPPNTLIPHPRGHRMGMA